MAAIAVALGLIAAPFLHQLREQKVNAERLAAPLPEHDRALLRARIAVLNALPAELAERYFRQVKRLVHGKRFVGCGGQGITDEIRLVIAGWGALLRLQPQAEALPLYPTVKAVLVYPAAFRVPQTEPDELGLVDDEPQERIGESWTGDRIVLSWTDVQLASSGDPVNVAVHEFAHALDDEGPAGEGAPPLLGAEIAQDEWARVLGEEYARLRRHRRPPVLDPYGATSPGEFFGVVSEAFVQQPVALRQHHGALYALLVRYYGFDPAVLVADAAPA